MAISVGGIFKGIGIATVVYMVGKTVANNLIKRISIVPKQAQVDLSSFPALFRVRWNFEIENGTGIPATILSLKGEIWFGDLKLSNISIDNPIVLTPHEKRNVQFVLEFPPIQMLGDLIASGINNGVGMLMNKIRFVGKINTSLVTVPIDMYIPIV